MKVILEILPALAIAAACAVALILVDRSLRRRALMRESSLRAAEAMLGMGLSAIGGLAPGKGPGIFLLCAGLALLLIAARSVGPPGGQ